MSLMSFNNCAELDLISLINTVSSSALCSIWKSSAKPTTVVNGVRISKLMLWRNAFFTTSTSWARKVS